MTLRAEQWAMVGVVTIGITAAYLLTRAKPRVLDAGGYPPVGGEPPFPTPPLPAKTPSVLQQNILRVGPTPSDPMRATLRRGNNVLGRLELGLIDGAGDNATALQNLQRAGFANVQLYTPADVQANPDLVPLSDARTNPGPGTRWFWATWNGNGTVASAEVLAPRELVLLWYTATKPTPRPVGPPATGLFVG